MSKEQDLLGSPGNDFNSQEFVVVSPGAYYNRNGLTVTSNNNAIIPRDSLGNIIIQENNINNPLLIIEPVSRQIDKKSFLQTIETRFQYFNFPATIINTGDIELPDIELNDVLIDPIYARYKPTEPRKILASNVPSGILMDELVDGNPTQKINSYVVNKLVKNSGADLRFRIKLEHRFDTPNDENGVAFFYISKVSPDSGLNRTYLGPYYNSSFTSEQQQQFDQIINDLINETTIYCNLILENVNYDANIGPAFEQTIATNILNSFNSNVSMLTQNTITYINTLLNSPGDFNLQIDAINSTLRNTIQILLNEYLSAVEQSNSGYIGQYGVQSLFIDVIIPNNTLKIGDSFGITAIANVNEEFRYHTINSDTSYWSITDASKVVDEWNQPIIGKV